MKLRRALPVAATLAALIVLLLVGIWLIRFGLGAFDALFGDWRQIAVASIAALTMGAVGLKLTTGHGNLATAGQYEKIAVWAALLMSIVSAITTSLGLLLVLSPNPNTGAVLMIGMALLLGLGIQLSMLMYALRIGQGLQRLTPVAAELHSDEDVEPAEDRQRQFPIWGLIGILLLFALGIAMFYGQSLVDVLQLTLKSLIDSESVSKSDPKVLGPVLIVLGLIFSVYFRLMTRPGTVAGLLVSLAIYFMLLVFSSGFGFLSYFLSTQSDEVRAIDRDNRIETETAALVRRIRDAATEDVREALLEARSGDDYRELSDRVDRLSELFVDYKDNLNDQIKDSELQLQRFLAERENQASKTDGAAAAVRDAELRVSQAEAALKQAESARARRMPTLESDLIDAEKERDDAAAGRDRTGVAKCGPICKAAETRIERINTDIKSLNDPVNEASAGVEAALRTLAAAKRTVETLEQTGEFREEVPVPVVIVDRTSFTAPRNEYNVNPTKEGLKRISQTCATAADMLINFGLSPREIPSCEVSNVEAWLTRHDEGLVALQQMEIPCNRTKEELAKERNALLSNVPPNINEIPEHLRARLAWVTRCLTVANTGSPRMQEVARTVNRLESEYTAPGYDVRRVLRALADGNLFAVFAVVIALVVDTAILFAGFAANAYRGRELGEDPRLVAPDRIAERIRKTLEATSFTEPHTVALKITSCWEQRTVDEVGQTPFTHKLLMDGVDSADMQAMRLVLDAAGPAFARVVRHNGDRSWLLHHNLVALIIEHATETGGSSAGWSSRAGGMEFSSSNTGNSATSITPRLQRLPSDKTESGKGNVSARKINLGPEVSEEGF